MSKSAHRTDTKGGVSPKVEPTKATPKAEPTKATSATAAPAAPTPKSDEVDVKECLKKLTELSTDFKMRLDEHEERIKFLEKLAAKSVAAKPEPTGSGATKAGGAPKGDSKPTEGESDKGFASIFAAFGKADTPTGDPKSTKAEPTSAMPKATPAGSATKATPAAPAAKAAPAAPAAKTTPAEPDSKATKPDPKATKPDPVPVFMAGATACYAKSGPGYGFKYWDARTRTWGLTPDIWKARQLSNGVYEPIWVWYDKDGGIDHILSSDELLKYVP